VDTIWAWWFVCFQGGQFLQYSELIEFNGYGLCDFVCYNISFHFVRKNWLKLFSKYVGSFLVWSCPAAIRLSILHICLDRLFCSNICIEFLLALFKWLNQFALIGQVILMDHGRNLTAYFFIFLITAECLLSSPCYFMSFIISLTVWRWIHLSLCCDLFTLPDLIGMCFSVRTEILSLRILHVSSQPSLW